MPGEDEFEAVMEALREKLKKRGAQYLVVEPVADMVFGV